MKISFFRMAAIMFCCGVVGAVINHAAHTPRRVEAAVNIVPRPAASQTRPAAPLLEVRNAGDEECTRLLNTANEGEALQWLSDPTENRAVTQWDKASAIEMVKGFYAAGAARVTVVDTENVGPTEVASEFIVELPQDPIARQKVFAKDAEFEAQYSASPARDFGQKYLLVVAD